MDDSARVLKAVRVFNWPAAKKTFFQNSRWSSVSPSSFASSSNTCPTSPISTALTKRSSHSRQRTSPILTPTSGSASSSGSCRFEKKMRIFFCTESSSFFGFLVASSYTLRHSTCAFLKAHRLGCVRFVAFPIPLCSSPLPMPLQTLQIRCTLLRCAQDRLCRS